MSSYYPKQAGDIAFSGDLLESGRVYFRNTNGEYIRVCNVRNYTPAQTYTGQYEIWFGEDWETLPACSFPDRIEDGDYALWVREEEPQPSLTDKECAALSADILSDTSHIPVVLEMSDAYILILLLQLACRHPGIPEGLKSVGRNIADSFTDEIESSHPGAGVFIERGWNERLDSGGRDV